MFSKIRSITLVAIASFCLSISYASEGKPSSVSNERPTMTFDFDQCFAFSGPASYDYSEMQPEITANPRCSGLSLISPSLYRIKPTRNGHSCAPGINGSIAMCISSSESCGYIPGDEKSIRMNVIVDPGPDGLGSLSHISFSSMAPQIFEYIDGTTGPNDYPTRFRVRITGPNGEVYRSDEQVTTRTWSRKDFDLEDVSGLTVSQSTMFQIEILPYCLVGNGATSQAWDIDNLVISGGCNGIKGGTLTTTSETEMCTNNSTGTTVSVSVSGNKGAGSAFVVVDRNDIIVRVSQNGFFDFAGLTDELYSIFHIAHDGSLSGLSQGVNLGSLQGCFDLSRSILIRMNTVVGGSLLTNDFSSDFFVCPNRNNTLLGTTLTGNQGENVLYILSSNGIIISSSSDSNIDLSNQASGRYTLQALSYTGQLTGLFAGQSVSNIGGCTALSTGISVQVLNTAVQGGTLSTGGLMRIDFCGVPGNVPLELIGNNGAQNVFIVTNVGGTIIGIDNSNPVDLSALNETLCYVWNLSYTGPLSGLNIGGLVSNLNGCFDLSNPIEVTKNEVATSGNLTLSDGSTSFSSCPNQGNTIITATLNGSVADNVLYVLTQNGNIIQSFNNPTIDLASYGTGEFELVALAYNGAISGLNTGQPLSQVDGCLALSNSITISILAQAIDGGSISAEGGQTSFEFCGFQRILLIDLVDAVGPNSTYLLTTPSGRILNITSFNFVDFSELTVDECLIWHLSFADGLSGLVVDGLVSDLDGCFDLSNSITLLKANVDAGTISTGGASSTALCLKNNENQAVNVTLTGQTATQDAWVITDADGNILEITQPDNNNNIDFNNAGIGTCFIYHIAYEGNITGLTSGQNISGLDADCLDLSNAITVDKVEVESGTITGPASYDVCINDVANSSIDFEVSGFAGNFGTWLVTEANGDILETNTTSVIDFSGAGDGVCNVYFIAHSETPITYNGLANISTISLNCFELSEPVTVTRKQVEGGMISLANGATTVTVLVGQGTSATVTVDLAGATGDDNVYVVTDEQGVILEIQSSNIFDFDAAGLGLCSIYNLSSCGAIGGLAAGNNISGLTGCFDLSNPVVVTREQMPPPDTLFAGVIVTSDSLTIVDICLGQVSLSQEVNVVFTADPIGPQSVYVVTDDQGIVLDTSQTPTFTFDSAGVGSCNIYHLVFDASFGGLNVGDDISLFTGNFDLSDSIVVNREVIAGGNLLTSDSLTNVTIVVGDGLTDEIQLLMSGAIGDSSVILITDGAGMILEFPTLPLTFDDNTPPGMCLVWNLTFNDGLQGLELNALVAELDGCFALSNPVTIVKEQFNPMDTLQAGTLTADVDAICLGVDSGEVTTVLMNAIGDTSTYVITDDAGIILDVVPDGGFTGQTFTFDIAQGVGVCNIYHLSSTGALTGLTPGEDILNLSGMFEISNFVSVDRRIADGGTLTAVSDTITVIVGDGIIDSINVTLTAALGDSMIWLVTDTSGVIEEINSGPPFTFENAGEGTCLIWNLSTAFSTPNISVGDTATITGCADLSNPIVVNKVLPMTDLAGGTLFSNVDQICLGQDSLVPVVLVNAVGDSSRYIITDDSLSILEIITDAGFMGDTLTFGPGTPSGICNIYHLSSIGTITGVTVGQSLNDISGNFELSNSLSVDRQGVVPGVIALSNGMDTMSLIVGDGIIDSIDVTSIGAVGDSLLWLVTDSTGVVLEINSGPPFTFENAGAGACVIYHLSTAFDPIVLVGDTISNLMGCLALSNPITVTRTEDMSALVGGMLDTDVTAICLGQDSLVVTSLVGAVGDTSTYIITDDVGVILEVLPDGGFMGQTLTFGAATPTGICNIYHMSSTGIVTGLMSGDTITNLNGDFALSNSVAIDRQAVVGGNLLTTNGVDSLGIIVGDGMIDSIEVVLTGAVGDSLIWLVTDTAGMVLEINSGPPFTFEGSGAGTCLIWNLSTNFGVDVSVGDDATALTGCIELSNPITVTKEAVMNGAVEGGDLETVAGDTLTNVCLSSAMTVIDSVTLTGAVGDSSLYVITDMTGFILATFQNPPFNFSGTQTGMCQILHVSYNGIVTSLNSGSNIANVMGDFDLSNPITVDRNSATGGSLTAIDSSQNVTVTVGDTMTDTIAVILTGAMADTMSWLITDTLGNIIDLPLTDPFDFTNADPGICWIWNLSYATGLNGLVVGNNVSQLAGCFALSDSVVVTKEASMNVLVGGNLRSLDTTTVDVCLSGTNATIDLMLTGQQGPNSDFLLVSSNTGNILSISNVPSLTISGTINGNCEAYHISYDSTAMGLTIGMPFNGLSGNFDLSNAVIINKLDNDPGILSYNGSVMPDTITVGDGIIDTLNLSLSGMTGDTSLFVLTDANGVILDIQTDNQFVVDDNSAPGDCDLRSITFNFGLQGLEIGNNINLDLVGCFASTNLLSLVKEAVVNNNLVAGVLSSTMGADTIDLCIGANGGVVDLNLTGAMGPEMAFFITDANGMILGIPQALPVTFNSANPPSCDFYHLVHDGTLSGLIFGNTLDSLSGNFLLSNAVVVNKTEVVENSIMFSDSTTTVDITVGDGMIDTLNVISSPISTDTSVFILVDANGVIDLVQDNPQFTFGAQISGTCTIYELSYDTGFTGVMSGMVLSNITGCFGLSNVLTVNKNSVINVNGGVITTPIGNNLSICKTDMANDTIFASVTSALGGNMSWVITDDNGIIVDLPAAPPFVLDTSSLESCSIWHLSFETPLSGLAIGNSMDSLSGLFDFSDTPITVDKNSSIAGSLLTDTGMQFDTIILGNMPPDSLRVTLSGVVADTSTWVVTDTFGNMILLPTGEPPFTLEVLNQGVCELRNIAYSFGLTGLQVNNNLSDLEGCFAVSDSIFVVKVNSQSGLADGGTLATASGDTIAMTCLGDMSQDTLDVTVSGQSGMNFSYLITNKDGVLLSIQDTTQNFQSNASINIEFNSDSLMLYHMAYDLPLNGFSLFQNISGFDGVFSLSNPIILLEGRVSAQPVLTAGNTTFMVGDGNADVVVVDPFGGNQPIGDTIRYMVYDTLGVIQAVDTLSQFDFENYEEGEYFIVQIASNAGTTGIVVGENINDIDGCFDLSTTPVMITTIQAVLSGGNLMTVDSTLMESFCFNSTVTVDTVDVILTDTLGDNFAWIIADTFGIILDLPMAPPFGFDSMDSSVCEIYNIAFDSTLVGLVVGEDLDTLMSIGGSFLFSDTITITKRIVEGGSLTTPSGETQVEYCAGDGDPNVLFLELTGAVGNDFNYIVTNPSGDIQLLLDGQMTSFPIDALQGDTCFVWNVSAADEVLGLVVGNNVADLVGCFELSTPITLIKSQVDAGIISGTPAGVDNIIDFCVTDGLQDSLVLSNSSLAGSYAYLLTDDNAIVTDVLASDTLNFEGAAFGTCRIYGVSYTGAFTAMVGDSIGRDSLASQCYDFSTIPLTINKLDCSQPVVNEISADNTVEIKNIGTSPIDVSAYNLCSSLSYSQLSNLTLVCGDLVLDPGDFVVVDLSTGPLNVDSADGEMGLYKNSAFSSPDGLCSYVEWGSTAHQRSALAVTAGVWSTGEFVPAFSAGDALKYDGDGISAMDWTTGTPTDCADGLIGQEPIREISFEMYPNPATEMFNLKVKDLIEDTGILQVFNSFGKLVMSMEVLKGMTYEMDMSSFGAGVYYSKIISGYSDKMEKMILIK